MPTNNDLRKEITLQIIEAIKSGVKPWKRPWRASPNAGRPANVTNKRCYTGVNPLIIELHQLRHNLSSRWYATIAGWKAIGCRVSNHLQSRWLEEGP